MVKGCVRFKVEHFGEIGEAQGQTPSGFIGRCDFTINQGQPVRVNIVPGDGAVVEIGSRTAAAL
jgi:hypothetical protein